MFMCTYVYTYLDVNECARRNGGCGHNCVNNQGSYKCSCRRGYAVQSDGRTCKG